LLPELLPDERIPLAKALDPALPAFVVVHLHSFGITRITIPSRDTGLKSRTNLSGAHLTTSSFAGPRSAAKRDEVERILVNCESTHDAASEIKDMLTDVNEPARLERKTARPFSPWLGKTALFRLSAGLAHSAAQKISPFFIPVPNLELGEKTHVGWLGSSGSCHAPPWQ
jgi:hypothetical protein